MKIGFCPLNNNIYMTLSITVYFYHRGRCCAVQRGSHGDDVIWTPSQGIDAKKDLFQTNVKEFKCFMVSAVLVHVAPPEITTSLWTVSEIAVDSRKEQLLLWFRQEVVKAPSVKCRLASAPYRGSLEQHPISICWRTLPPSGHSEHCTHPFVPAAGSYI